MDNQLHLFATDSTEVLSDSSPTVLTNDLNDSLPTVACPAVERQTFISFTKKYAKRIWKAEQHRKRSLAQADRFSKFDVVVGLSIDQITADHILSFQDHLSNQGLSASSVNRYSATISKILDWAADLDVIIKRPKVIFMEEEKGRINTYTDTQISQFAQWARGRGDQWFADMIIIAANTGMRSGEIQKIGNEAEAFVFTDSYGTAYLRLNKTKTGEGRDVPLNQFAAEAVESYASNRLNFGQQYTHRKFYRRLNLLRREFRLGKDDCFHTLRHSCASRLSNDTDANALQIADILGHKNLATTRKYVHSDNSALHNIVSKVAIG